MDSPSNGAQNKKEQRLGFATLGRFVWAYFLFLWAVAVSIVARQTGLAGSGDKTASTDGGATTHTATIPEEFSSSLATVLYFTPEIAIVGLVATLICWAVHRVFFRYAYRKMAFKTVAWLGWVPGLAITFITMGALFSLITGIRVVLASFYSATVYDDRFSRPIQFLAATIVSAIWFFFP